MLPVAGEAVDTQGAQGAQGANQAAAGSANQTGIPKTTGLIKDNRLEVFEDQRYRYDTHGNLIEKRIGSHTFIRLIWDVEHQLTEAKVTRKHTTQTTSDRYDAFGRRLEKKNAFGQTLFGWDGNRLLSEQRGEKHKLYM